ncbi:MAG: bifunctional DNA primase/polymerase [Chloroflexota bacterium]
MSTVQIPCDTSPLQQQTFDTLRIARHYVAAGLSVMPIAPGSKEPAHRLLPRVYDETTDDTRPSWKMYQERVPYDKELIRWFDREQAGIAIICGQVSHGLVVLDLESPAHYERWRELACFLLDDELLLTLPVVGTGKGRHVYFRMAEPIGNRKLAVMDRQVVAETRGEGGYVLAPPSVHPSGASYTLVHGDLDHIPVLEHNQALALLDAAEALVPTVVQVTHQSANPTGNDVIGTFNQTYTIEHILDEAGYRCERPGRYIRPDGERSSIILVGDKSIHYNSNDPLYKEAPGGKQYAQTPFSAWCMLQHQGDVKAAVKAAAHQLGLSQHQTSADLLAQAGRALGLGEAATDTWPYFLHEGGMWMQQHSSDGTPKAPLLLCNFTAQIVAETILDDGEQQDELYTIKATCLRRSRNIELKRTEFESETALTRIVATLGARARVNPKTQPKYILDAIKAFSAEVPEHTIYTHTGWVEGRYLLGNGYVDRHGWHPSTDCHLPQRLRHYQFTPPSNTLSEALTLFDTLLDIVPSRVMVPLLGGVLLGPVLHTIETSAPMIHVFGPTGCHKTSITCAALALFGDFTPAQPTDTWTSTANSIQRLGWHLKDMPMLLDDYKAANVKPQHVTFLLQNYGDNMARGRLDANSEVRSAFPIRGALISSGEDQPEGEASTLARILSVQLERQTVHRGKLTEVQQHARQLQLLTIDYLTWLASAPDLTGNRDLYQATRASILSRLEDATEHATNPGRIASNVAALYVSWDTFSRFLAARNHWPPERIQAWMLACKRDLLNLAKAQLELTTQERYSQIFLETVRGLLVSGKAVIINLDGQGHEPGPAHMVLGAQDSRGTYLIAQVSYDEVCKHLRAAGRNVGFSLRALSQLLHQDGLLQTTDPPSLVIRKRINGARPWCWHLPHGILAI